MRKPPPLPTASPVPATFYVKCPTCAYMIEDMEFEQDHAGFWHAPPADSYPLCESCGVQFEIGLVAVVPRDG